MRTHDLAVLLVIRTDEPKLHEDAISGGMHDARSVAQVRRLVLKSLPHAVERVVAVMTVEEAQIMFMAREMALQEMNLTDLTHRPPPDYVPPTRE